MSVFVDALAAYGADVKGALKRFVDDEELYEQCLQEFAYDACLADLERAIEARDANAAFMAAHTLKGVAASLGLDPLLPALSALAEPLRAGSLEEVEVHYAAFKESFARVPFEG